MTIPVWLPEDLRPTLGDAITADMLAEYLEAWTAYMAQADKHREYANAITGRSLAVYDGADPAALGPRPVPPPPLPPAPLLLGRWLPPMLAPRAAITLGLPKPAYSGHLVTPEEVVTRNYQHVESWPFPSWYGAPPHARRFKARDYKGKPVVIGVTAEDWVWTTSWRLTERPAQYWSEVGPGPELVAYQKRARNPTPREADSFAIHRWELA